MTELIQLESTKNELAWNRYEFPKFNTFFSLKIKLSGKSNKPQRQGRTWTVDLGSDGSRPAENHEGARASRRSEIVGRWSWIQRLTTCGNTRSRTAHVDLARANGVEVVDVDLRSDGTRPEGEDRGGPDQLGEVLYG